MGDLKLKMK